MMCNPSVDNFVAYYMLGFIQVVCWIVVWEVGKLLWKHLGK